MAVNMTVHLLQQHSGSPTSGGERSGCPSSSVGNDATIRTRKGLRELNRDKIYSPSPALQGLVQSSSPVLRSHTSCSVDHSYMIGHSCTTFLGAQLGDTLHSSSCQSTPTSRRLSCEANPSVGGREIISTRMKGAWQTMPRGVFSRSQFGAVGERLIPLPYQVSPSYASACHDASGLSLSPAKESKGAWEREEHEEVASRPSTQTRARRDKDSQPACLVRRTADSTIVARRTGRPTEINTSASMLVSASASSYSSPSGNNLG